MLRCRNSQQRGFPASATSYNGYSFHFILPETAQRVVGKLSALPDRQFDSMLQSGFAAGEIPHACQTQLSPNASETRTANSLSFRFQLVSGLDFEARNGAISRRF
jgi:hypothetical protein